MPEHTVHANDPDKEPRCGTKTVMVYGTFKRSRVDCPECLKILADAERLKSPRPTKE